MNKKALTVIMVTALTGFVTDKFFKWMALNSWGAPILPNKFFGWEPLINPGVAFGIPLPNWLIVIFSVIVLAVVGYAACRLLLTSEQQSAGHPTAQLFSFTLIFFGALSNFIDRVNYQYTIDYLRFFASIINLADVMIVIGFVIYLIKFSAPNKN